MMRPQIAVLSLLIATGCAGLIPQKKKDPLTQDERERLRAAGGDELVADTETAMTGGDNWKTSELRSCLKYYAAGQKDNEWLPYRECARTCRQSQEDSAPHPELAAKYGARCQEKYAALHAGPAVGHAQAYMEMFRNSKSPFEWSVNAKAMRAELDKTQAEVGADNPDLKAAFDEYNSLTAAHRKEIAKGEAFLTRPDIVDLQAEIATLNAEIADIKRRYMDRTTADLLRVKESRRDLLIRRNHDEAVKAGVLR
jgi:hypothetical protein